jgi:hypothetical protein
LTKGTVEGCVIPREVVSAVKVQQGNDAWVEEMDKCGFKGAALLASAKALITKHARSWAAGCGPVPHPRPATLEERVGCGACGVAGQPRSAMSCSVIKSLYLKSNENLPLFWTVTIILNQRGWPSVPMSCQCSWVKA